ncbi:hypothetical protein P7D85_10880 [Enterococcus hulanensis]|uniref:Uncharacterized protein n=1 Tax=Enterococcus hulanensis TaxID=2559929 RepID=A0ABU3EZG6_9ENTE|nr:hypothetical protein [Enterococcus hulanensis]MDT2600280.1 hypothetical protein [Enterococcus hulanensis]MDT2609093.1 hypothetical protein [Enterococcus hulanensis]MDT2616865.1 hypothetical protein [Enterococcus hulanensis]MDT2628615.1 hypothetical protein [Enterococcus hulanensis]MDT2655955.1 hypothetical protein [Enterococcus hulanensis]
MDLKLNLLQGSYDYLINFLFSYKASEKDYNTQSYYHQLKLKSALIDLCQAYELLLKQILYSIQPNLIYTDIDKKSLLNAHTISFRNAINRVRNFTNYEFEEQEEKFLNKFNEIRNSFVHFETNIKVDELKDYCLEGLDYYFKIHDFFVSGINLDFLKDKRLEKKIKVQIKEIREIRQNHVFYRGYAFSKEELEFLLNLQKKDNPEFLYVNGEQEIKRIRFGQENHIFSEMNLNEMISDLYEYTYCSECKVPLGEFHLYSYPCDLEVCPNCGGQLISCNCNLSVVKTRQ